MLRAGRLALLLPAAILVLNGGDCLSMWLASREAKDCCARGRCTPSKDSSPTGTDRCCQSIPASVSGYLQSAKQPHADVQLQPVPLLFVYALRVPELAERAYPEACEHSPPFATPAINLPLLI